MHESTIKHNARAISLVATAILFIALICSGMTQTVFAAKNPSAADQAKKYCNSKFQKNAEANRCIAAFKAGYNNGDQAYSCSFSDRGEANACRVGFSKGADAAKSDGAGYCSNKSCQSQGGGSTESCTQDDCDLIKQYINPTINLLSVLFGLIAAGSLIMGGIQFSTSEGDPQKAAKAKARISATILAVFAYGFIWAFLQFLIPGGLFK